MKQARVDKALLAMPREVMAALERSLAEVAEAALPRLVRVACECGAAGPWSLSEEGAVAGAIARGWTGLSQAPPPKTRWDDDGEERWAPWCPRCEALLAGLEAERELRARAQELVERALLRAE